MDARQSIALAQRGEAIASEMFASAQAANRALAWILRGAGFLLLLVGFVSVLKPLSVFADVVPMIGSLVGVGTTLVSFALAGFLSLFTIALGWLFYRPLRGIALLAAAGALGFWLVKTVRQRRGTGAPALTPAGAADAPAMAAPAPGAAPARAVSSGPAPASGGSP